MFPMKCHRCAKPAVHGDSAKRYRCRDHFLADFERRVWKTITAYRMIAPSDAVAVAVSGGKDSMALLHVLAKKCDVTALCVDEGIVGYREKTLAHLRRYCTAHNILLKVASFQGAFGKTLDEEMQKGGDGEKKRGGEKKHPCTICGTRRRDVLNTLARGFGKLATGHNLDDEAQTVLMNLCTHKTDFLAYQRPVSAKGTGFTQRIKPFCMIPEKEVLLYAVLNNLQSPFVECPYMHDAFRNDVRDALNAYEAGHPGTKRNIYEAHLAWLEKVNRKSESKRSRAKSKT